MHASSKEIPAPAAVLGRDVSVAPARSDEIARYLQTLAAASSCARLTQYGTTAGGRPLSQLTVSSPRNLSQLEAIQAKLRQLAATDDAAHADVLISSLPTTVWIGCGIHGDEISGPDAALEAAYRLLADAGNGRTREWLEKLVIHIDANANPDGRERYLQHVTAFARRAPATDPQDVLHNAFWPDGRGNHYLFDLNRDAIFTVQAEARARVAALRAAQPQLHIDAHEMGAADTFLFAVPAEPLNPHLPASVHDSWRDFAQDHGAAFDADGTSYYTRSWNEVFYPGFFDIWPAYSGAVPILYEQAATAGGAVELPNGKCRTYREAIEHQLRSLLSNLATAARLKDELLRRWWRAQRDAVRAGENGPAAWVVLPDDAFKLRNVARVLHAQGIVVERLFAPVHSEGLHSLWQQHAISKPLPAGTLLVRCAQPLGRLVRNIFDFHVPLTPNFVERERRALDAASRTRLFDVTAWSLPLAYGLEAYWLSSEPVGQWMPLEPAGACGTVPAVRAARYGYLIRDPSLHATCRLLMSGIKVRTAREPFALAGRSFEPGTMLVRNDDQTGDVRAALERANAAGDADITEVDSARILEGPDLGGRELELLEAPRIAVLTGIGTNATSTGAVWHLFDEVIGVPVTLLDVTRIAAVDLSRYNVLVLGDVSDPDLVGRMLGEGELACLRHWLHAGGTVLALSGGARLLAERGLTACEPRAQVIDRHPPQVFGNPGSPALPVIGAGATAFTSQGAEAFAFPEDAPCIAALDMDAALRRYLPRGAYVRVDFRPFHWLRYGVADRLPALFREADALICERSTEVVGCYGTPQELALSGLLWPEAVGYIARTGYLMRERVGRGQIVLFANDPVFRGYSLGTQRLFLNAVVMGPGLRLT